MNLESVISKIEPLKAEYFELAQKRLDILTKPRGSLGRLEEFARRLVAIYRQEMPALPRKAVFVFSGDHGVAEEGVSAFPQEVTPQMVYNFLSGGAAINVLARHAGADVAVVDVGVNHDFGESAGLIRAKVLKGTGNISRGPAMSRDDALKCIGIGYEIAMDYSNRGFGMFATGEMGIANTTPSTAIAAVITGKSPGETTGKGTGIDDASLRKKIDVIERAINVNKPDKNDPIGVLAAVGGTEIAAIAGLCLGAASAGVPVVVDGFISTAGALIAYCLCPTVKDYMFGAHRSQEPGHMAMLDFIGLSPVLDLQMRLGEGTGAAIAMTILDASLKIYREMATFKDAGVTDSGK
ncbi:MAG: nicotinate-nucleotide--dimethylbenzimidazole phosphoribosyltransferase [Nitrospirae bacterium]|nr:nicotinate-nucleotide--dimethylbenzimidazole phosphoribosyltransferase [Nitrospirota bacterium]